MTNDLDLSDLDPELRDALKTALAERPGELRDFLSTRGFLTTEDNPDIIGNEQELSNPEARLLTVVEDLSSPRSTKQIVELIQREDQYEDLREEYNSVKHRPWVNDKLNKLAEKGEIGGYRDGRTKMYTGSVKDAIRHWARVNNRFVSDLSMDDVDDIVRDTTMNRQAVANALYSLLQE